MVVKLNEHYNNAITDIYPIHSVRKNRNDKVSATYGQSADWPAGLTLNITYSHFSCELEKEKRSDFNSVRDVVTKETVELAI